ncbi:MAG TPA: tetratricopeptide repeat protein [Chthonomonadaceae bacterium]|nr:tetratricopeptide repeat protein [Chthonomonadaceae bacterium]
MKPSNVSSVPPSNRIAVPSRASAAGKRIALLIGLLIFLAILLPISRHYLLSKPPPPPASADIRTRMHYYASRIEADPSDIPAYVELGKLDEASGYFMAALKNLTIARALGAKDPEIVLPLGRSLTYLARFDEAQVELNRAVQLMPDSLEAAANLAGLYEAYGSPEEASKTLQAFLARHPPLETGVSPHAKNDIERLLFCFLQAGDNLQALKMAEDLIRLAPDRPEGYSIAGKLLLAQHQPKPALEYLEHAARLAPNEAALCYQYGLALAQNGREEEALRQWEKTVALNPNAMDAYYRLAETYGKRKDYTKTAATLQIIALYENTNLTVIRATALAFDQIHKPVAAAYWRSLEARLRKDYPAALAYSRQVVADPAWRNRGLATMAEAYRGMNRMDDYLDTVRQLTTSHTAEADVTMANAYGVADRLQEQVQFLKSALTKKPSNPAAIYQLLSQVALRKGLRAEAEPELEQAVTLDPKNVNYHLQLGDLYLERRSEGDRLQRALREFKQVTQLSPGETVGFQKLGVAYAAAGDYQRAANNLEHVLDLQPGEGSNYQELGRVYAHLGDKAGSERMLQLYHKFVSYDLQRQTLITRSTAARHDPAAQVALAEFLERAGDYPAAVRYYRLAYALQPKDTTLRTKIEQLYTRLGQTSN